jgi:tetratricopeptide (TPR) repeat protein
VTGKSTFNPRSATHILLAAAAAAAAALLLITFPAVAGEVEWRQLHDQASAHLQRGNFEQAELFGRAALKEAESSFAPDHRAVEQSLATLYGAVRNRGKIDEALPLVSRLAAIRTRQYGSGDPTTAMALHGQAEILLMQNKFAEAEKLQRQALTVFEKKLGATHINTAVALHNMGAIQLKQEKFKEAEKFLRSALAAKEKALKPGHLSIAHTLDNLALALDRQGRQIEAERLRKRAEGIRQRAQAPAKPGV